MAAAEAHPVIKAADYNQKEIMRMCQEAQLYSNWVAAQIRKGCQSLGVGVDCDAMNLIPPMELSPTGDYLLNPTADDLFGRPSMTKVVDRVQGLAVYTFLKLIAHGRPELCLALIGVRNSIKVWGLLPLSQIQVTAEKRARSEAKRREEEIERLRKKKKDIPAELYEVTDYVPEYLLNRQESHRAVLISLYEVIKSVLEQSAQEWEQLQSSIARVKSENPEAAKKSYTDVATAYRRKTLATYIAPQDQIVANEHMYQLHVVTCDHLFQLSGYQSHREKLNQLLEDLQRMLGETPYKSMDPSPSKDGDATKEPLRKKPKLASKKSSSKAKPPTKKPTTNSPSLAIARSASASADATPPSKPLFEDNFLQETMEEDIDFGFD